MTWAAILLLLSAALAVTCAEDYEESETAGTARRPTPGQSDDMDDGSGGSGMEPNHRSPGSGSEKDRLGSGCEKIGPAQEVILIMGCIVAILCTGTPFGLRC